MAYCKAITEKDLAKGIEIKDGECVEVDNSFILRNKNGTIKLELKV